MTFSELARDLPNGFHDARIVEVTTNFATRVMSMAIELHVGCPNDSDPERRAAAVLTLKQFAFVVLEPPDARSRFLAGTGSIPASGDPDAMPPNDSIRALISQLPRVASYCQFFLDDWNCFMHVAASDVTLEWVLDSTDFEQPV